MIGAIGVLVLTAVGLVVLVRSEGESCDDRNVNRAAWFDGRKSEAKRMVRCDLLIGQKASYVRQLLAEEDFRNGSPPDTLIWNLDYNRKREELVIEIDRNGRVSDQYLARTDP